MKDQEVDWSPAFDDVAEKIIIYDKGEVLHDTT